MFYTLLGNTYSGHSPVIVPTIYFPFFKNIQHDEHELSNIRTRRTRRTWKTWRTLSSFFTLSTFFTGKQLLYYIINIGQFSILVNIVKLDSSIPEELPEQYFKMFFSIRCWYLYFIIFR
jgi:hypothetical protein